jgi:Asp-tRNA(Asn)/Glu-tRNA(Gln) amidotransferase B subunit
MDSEENKMKTSDTPRSDAAEYHQYDTQPPLPLGLVDVEFARKLETELNTAIVNEAFAENKTYTLEKQLKQANERIKQLEELYEGEIGERPELLGSNLLGLLKRELNAAQQHIKRLKKAGDALVLLINATEEQDLCSWIDNAHDTELNWLKAKDAKL